jgi:hypothetical protein
MGMWNMTVLGTGAHHNFKQEKRAWTEGDGSEQMCLVPDGKGGYARTIDYDADLLFTQFVEKLRALGHQIEHASFTHGGRDTVAKPAA